MTAYGRTFPCEFLLASSSTRAETRRQGTADDYLVKPFGPRELLARVRAPLRRALPQPFQPPSRRYAFDRFVALVQRSQCKWISVFEVLAIR